MEYRINICACFRKCKEYENIYGCSSSIEKQHRV